MDIEKITKVLKEGNGNLQVPVRFQLKMFGLDDALIQKYLQANVLDIGCGDGSLVNYLRQRGVACEGIDLNAPGENYFIKQNIYGTKPMNGAIPRQDNFYELVLAFQNTMLNRGFTLGNIVHNPRNWGGDESDMEDHTRRVTNAQFIIYEGTRVLKPGKRFLVYPEARRLEEVMGPMLRMQGIDFFTEDVEKEVAESYVQWETEQLGMKNNPGQKFMEDWGLLKRTVLQKR